MNDLTTLFRYQAEKREAYAKYCQAGSALELASIRERLAEIISQHEPLGSITALGLSPREACIQAAKYVVHGRNTQ